MCRRGGQIFACSDYVLFGGVLQEFVSNEVFEFTGYSFVCSWRGCHFGYNKLKDGVAMSELADMLCKTGPLT